MHLCEFQFHWIPILPTKILMGVQCIINCHMIFLLLINSYSTVAHCYGDLFVGDFEELILPCGFKT